MNTKLLPLDDPRWSELNQAIGSGRELPQMIRAIAELSHWDARVSIADKTTSARAWESLQAALYDQGNVRTGAYAALPHLLRLAQDGRSHAEQTLVLNMLLTLVLEALEGVADIPSIVAEGFEQAVMGCATMAREAALDLTRPRGSREICSAAYFLAKRDLLAAYIAYGVALDALSVPCVRCASDFKLRWEPPAWEIVFDDSSESIKLTGGGVAGRLDLISRFGVEAEFGDDIRNISQIDAVVVCSSCGVRSRVLRLAAAKLLLRAPLARRTGWEPTA